MEEYTIHPTRTIIRRDSTHGTNCTIKCGHKVGGYVTIDASVDVRKKAEPHTLRAGVSTKRIGWVCMFIQVLDIRFVCPDCGRRYKMINASVTTEGYYLNGISKPRNVPFTKRTVA